MNTIMANSIFQPEIFNIVETLTNGSVFALEIEKVKSLKHILNENQVCYGDCVDFLFERNLIAIGLYRSGEGGQVFYSITNPSKFLAVRMNDKIFLF